MIWYDIWWYDMILYYIYTWLYIDKVMSCVIIYLYTVCIYIYIYMILCIVDVCNGQVGWYIQFLDGTYMQCVYICILMYNICVRYIYIYTSRTIDISLLIVQKCEGWFTADSKSTPKKDAGKCETRMVVQWYAPIFFQLSYLLYLWLGVALYCMKYPIEYPMIINA